MVFTGSHMKDAKTDWGATVTIFKNMNYLHEYIFPKTLKINIPTLGYIHQLYLKAVWNVF